jgi:hypothetical protein
MGGIYWTPPGPLSAAPGKTNTDGSASASYYEWAFNRPADGNAVPLSGANFNVHWNGLAQIGYRTVDYYVVFSKNGVGDNRLDGFNQKCVNYAAGALSFDLQSLLGRTLPFELKLFGQSSDVALTPGLPKFGDAGKLGSADMPYFSETFSTAFSRFGVTPSLTLIGMAAYEEWKSNHSYVPINCALKEVGGGFDLDLAKLLSGLSLVNRTRIMYFDDYNLGARAFNMWEISIGTVLSF